MIPLFSVDLSSFVPSLNQSNFSEISPAAWESQGLQYLLRCTLCWWREPCCCLSFRKLDIPDMSSSSDDSLCTFYKTLTHSLRLSHRCSLSWLTCLWWPLLLTRGQWRRWDMTPRERGNTRPPTETRWRNAASRNTGLGPEMQWLKRNWEAVKNCHKLSCGKMFKLS